MSEGPTIGVYPGSFDPITKGHADIARRALRLVDRLVVGVAQTSSQDKRSLFTVPERVELIREVFREEPRVEVVAFSGLLVEFARSRGARLILRGLRAVSDFEYEFQMAQMNRSLWPEAETLFMAPDNRYTFLSASLVREVARLGGDVSPYVPEPVLRRIAGRLDPAAGGT